MQHNRSNLTLGERVQRCRDQVGVLDRNGWCHRVGEPLAIEPLSWYPDSMVQVHRLCNGLTTRLLWFHPYEELVKGLDETRCRDVLRLGDVCYSYPVMLDVATSELSIWDGEELMFADEYDEDDEDPEPVFRTPHPLGFFDQFVFGPRYPELIDRIIGFDGGSDGRAADEWRGAIGRA